MLAQQNLEHSHSSHAGRVMSNHKEMPNQMACVRYLLTTVHDGQMVETVKSRGVHEKKKPNKVTDYKMYELGVNKSDQMLSYYYIKSAKLWKNIFSISLILNL